MKYPHQIIIEVREQLARSRRKLKASRAECQDLQRTFDLMWKADMEAIKLWQKANPGNDMVWPDRRKLTRWLLDQIKVKKSKGPI